MYSEEEWSVMREHKRHEISISQVAKERGVNWRTARKYMQSPTPPKYKPRASKSGLLDPYKDYIKKRLESQLPFTAQKLYDDIPSGKAFPLRNIQLTLLGNIYRGEQSIEKVFTSTVSYQVALALYQGYKRIELYGIELTIGAEWEYQREAMTFWMGQAGGRGVDVWMPETCSLLLAPLYAYEVIRKADTGEIMLPEKDMVEWEEGQW